MVAYTLRLRIFITILCGLFKLILGAPDCAKFPPGINNMYDCCPFKTPIYDATEANCEKMRIKCIDECYYNATQVFTNGKVDLAKVKIAYQKETAAGPEYLPLMEKMFQLCDGKLKENMGKIMAKPQINGCNPYPENLSLCLESEFINNCPASKWKSTPMCNGFREYFKACPLKY